MFGAGRPDVEKRLQESADRAEFFAEAIFYRVAIGADHQQRHVVRRKIFRETLANFFEQRRNKFVRRHVAEQIDHAQQARFPEHLAVGVAGFDQRVGVVDDAIAGIELHVELLVVRHLEHPKRNIAEALRGGAGLFVVAQQRPLAVGSAIEQRARMSGVAQRKAASRRKKSRDHRGGETAVTRKFGELIVEELDKFFVVQAIHEAAHQGAEIRSGGRDRRAVAGNVGEQDAADAAGGAARNVVDVAAALRFAIGLAVNPHVEAAQFDAVRGELAAAPNFHAGHVLRGRIGHMHIIAGCGMRDERREVGLAARKQKRGLPS